jgi:molecular chaperone HtpG
VSTGTETLEFQAETKQLLDLMIHSLYTQKEIFLRELVSNASDALDKRRVKALENSDLEFEGEPCIRLDVDTAARTLTLTDNGIGMSRDDVINNIGTIAKSGTREFIEEMQEKDQAEADLPSLIGQFGVGFYSGFMVADRVVLETRKAGEEKGTRWESEGDGSFTTTEIDRDTVGTSITLHLSSQTEGDDEFQDFTSEWVLRDIVRKYSDFVEYPIEMDVERTEGEDDDKKTITKTEILNSQKPLWTRAKADVKDEEYNEFYKHISHDWTEPYDTIHFSAEGTSVYKALVFIPKQRPFEALDPNRTKSRVDLYVKRVHIESECENLMPLWLRFVVGVVDSEDLPLNVSRETLQQNRELGQIKKRVTRKVLEALKYRLENEREGYLEFWSSFGQVLKEGIYFDDGFQSEITGITLFNTTNTDGPRTLGEYIESMPEKQESIYYLAGEDKEALTKSVHLEIAAKLGYEVLLLSDSVDEFAFQKLTEYEGKSIVALDKGDLEFENEDGKEEREAKSKEFEPLLAAIKKELEDAVSEVRFSNRLIDSPVALVTGADGMTQNLERIMREARQPVPETARVLELNPTHPLVERLMTIHTDEGESTRFADYCDLLHGQALVREGSAVPHPEHFAKLIAQLML